MRSPDAVVVHRAPLRPLLAKELRDIVSGRALWTMLLILCPLVGYGFFQAVALYGEASSAARDAPVLATGLSPLDGVLVPTFGALYLAVTLLFPFVAIRSLGREKETGALRLLVQLPYRVPTLIAAKMTAIFGAWLAALIPAVSAVVIWAALGGHLYVPETANLAFGHLLYGLLVGAIALFAASISESSATAAIIALAFTIGSWVLDFALAGQPGVLEWVARLSLTQTLRTFEQGLLSIGLLLGHRGRDLRLCRAVRGVAAPRSAAAHQVRPFDRLRRRRRNGPRIGHADQDIGGPHRRSAQLVSCRRSAGAGRASRTAADHGSPGGRRTRATSICAATSWPSSSASFHVSPSGSPRRGKAWWEAPATRLTARSTIPMRAARTRVVRPARARFCRCSTRWRDGRFRRRPRGRSTPATRWSPTARPALLWFFGALPLLIVLAWRWLRRAPQIAQPIKDGDQP